MTDPRMRSRTPPLRAASVRPHSRIWCSSSKPLVLSGSWSLGRADRRNGASRRRVAPTGDTIIDGGNTRFHDDVRRSKELAKKVQYIDAGTSGGIWGLKVGYCLMVGGEEAVHTSDADLQNLGTAERLGACGRSRRRALCQDGS